MSLSFADLPSVENEEMAGYSLAEILKNRLRSFVGLAIYADTLAMIKSTVEYDIMNYFYRQGFAFARPGWLDIVVHERYPGNFHVGHGNRETEILLSQGYHAALRFIAERERFEATREEREKAAAKEKYEEMRDQLIGKYGRRVGSFLAARMAKAIRKTGKHSCINNLRIARTWHPIEMMEYGFQKGQGCCGSYDDRVVFVHRFLGIPYWKTTYLFGYNYGH